MCDHTYTPKEQQQQYFATIMTCTKAPTLCLVSCLVPMTDLNELSPTGEAEEQINDGNRRWPRHEQRQVRKDPGNSARNAVSERRAGRGHPQPKNATFVCV